MLHQSPTHLFPVGPLPVNVPRRQPTLFDHLYNGLLGASNALDLPGSSVRDVLAGQNPFDQWADPLGNRYHENRITGMDLLHHHGLINDNYSSLGNHAAGIAAEVVTDPVNALFGAAKLATHAARALPRVAAFSRPLTTRLAPALRVLPRRPNSQFGLLGVHNMIARTPPYQELLHRDDPAN